MLLRCKLIGRGVDGDPYRVNLPTYSHVHGNITHGYAIVNVPDDVHGLSETELRDEPTEDTTEGVLHLSLSDTNLLKLHTHLDHRYPQHKGKFRIENA